MWHRSLISGKIIASNLAVVRLQCDEVLTIPYHIDSKVVLATHDAIAKVILEEQLELSQMLLTHLCQTHPDGYENEAWRVLNTGIQLVFEDHAVIKHDGLEGKRQTG